MAFLKESEPQRGIPLDVLPGIRRIVANNPSVMTYMGTNTYLLDAPGGGLTIIDPGPKDDAHVADILRAAAGTDIKHIVLTHTHSDHSGAAAALKAATGAPVTMYKNSYKPEIIPDIPLSDGDEIAGLHAVFTPGHGADHLCFTYQAPGTGKILFSGDHVMSWSSSIVSPPEGNMLDYYNSLELLLGRDEVLYLPGHGPVLPEPRTLVAELLAHRQRRETSILHQMKAEPWSVGALAGKLYHKTDRRLKIAAQYNVLAHLLKLQDQGIVIELPPEDTGSGLKRMDPKLVKYIEDEGGVPAQILAAGLRRFSVAA
jgi:glyoxylase-like metal-dependent hydrolase (beta-lactamase superfamily II)